MKPLTATRRAVTQVTVLLRALSAELFLSPLRRVSVFGFITVAAAVCIIMAVPEAAHAQRRTAFVLRQDSSLCYNRRYACFIPSEAHTRKRSFSLRRRDAAVAVFALCVLTSGLFSLSEDGGDIAVKSSSAFQHIFWRFFYTEAPQCDKAL